MKIPLTKQDVKDARAAGLDDLADRIQETLDMDFWLEVVQQIIADNEADGFALAEWANG